VYLGQVPALKFRKEAVAEYMSVVVAAAAAAAAADVAVVADGVVVVVVDDDVDVDMSEVAVRLLVCVRIDTEPVVARFLLIYKKQTALGEVAPGRRARVAVDFSLRAQVEKSGCHGRHLAQMMYSFHGRDRWNRDCVLVGLAEILTWAERGMPLKEQCRGPL